MGNNVGRSVPTPTPFLPETFYLVALLTARQEGKTDRQTGRHLDRRMLIAQFLAVPSAKHSKAAAEATGFCNQPHIRNVARASAHSKCQLCCYPISGWPCKCPAAFPQSCHPLLPLVSAGHTGTAQLLIGAIPIVQTMPVLRATMGSESMSNRHKCSRKVSAMDAGSCCFCKKAVPSFGVRDDMSPSRIGLAPGGKQVGHA